MGMAKPHFHPYPWWPGEQGHWVPGDPCLGGKREDRARHLQDTWVQILTHMLSCAHANCTHRCSSSPQHKGTLPAACSQLPKMRVWGQRSRL